MAQYIDKDAVVAEIERRKENIKEYCVREGHDRRFDVVPEQLTQILSFINTLEVKEVDINKEISQFIDANFEKATIGHKLSLRRVAKHFFELGLKAKNEEIV